MYGAFVNILFFFEAERFRSIDGLKHWKSEDQCKAIIIIVNYLFTRNVYSYRRVNNCENKRTIKDLLYSKTKTKQLLKIIKTKRCFQP